MSAINRNLRHSSRSQPSSVGLERSRKLVISCNNVSRLLALPTKFQLTTLTRLNRSSLSIPIVYVVSVHRSVPSTVNQSLIVALVLKRLDYGNDEQAALQSYLHRRLLSILDTAACALIGRQPIHCPDLFTYTRQFSLAVIN
jgi:hypothetical protein